MANGKKLKLSEAKQLISAFQKRELMPFPPTQHEVERKKIAIGQKFDLSVIKDFLAAIEKHPESSKIDAIRIYIARSVRKGDTVENFDLVFVPVLTGDSDLHVVYDRKSEEKELDTIIGSGLPCPNVCPSNTLACM